MSNKKALNYKDVVSIELLGSDGKIYKVPVKDGRAKIPENWTEEMIHAYKDFMYPFGYVTIYKPLMNM